MPLTRVAVLPLAALVLLPARASAQRARPVFRDGQAQVVPAFADSSTWIRQELWVETSFDTDGDGKPDRVHVDVTRPGQTQSEGLEVPVIYESSPYYSGTGSTQRQYFWDVRQEVDEPSPPRTPMPSIRYRGAKHWISRSLIGAWVPRGFAVVHSEAPGTGASQGCPTVGGDPEALAPKAVIDWLNGRAKGYTEPVGGDVVPAPWSTGAVGMTGTSYNGTIPVAAATTGVEGLKAIIPVSPNTSYYRYYRSNGLVRSPGGYLGEDTDVLYSFIDSGDPARRGYCDRTIRDGELVPGEDRATGDYNPFWRNRDFMQRLGGIKAATFLAHGLNDWNVMPEHSIRVFEALEKQGVPTAMYLHQGGHGGPPPMELMNKWFTHFLYGVDNGIERGPKVWIVREGADRNDPTPYPDYPAAGTRAVTLHPTPGGVQTGGLALDASGSRGNETLVDNFSFDGATLAKAEWTDHRLIYATPVLADSTRISGIPRVTIRLAASKPAANLSVWLVELPYTEGTRRAPNPNESLITRGWADPQNHASLEHGEPLTPGTLYDVTFDLQPDDQIIPAGKRIALMIFSSDRQFTLWPDPGTELTVDLAGTSLTLPVVGGELRFGRGPS